MNGRISVADLSRDRETGRKIPLDSSENVKRYREHLKATKSLRTVGNYSLSARRFEEFLGLMDTTIEEAPQSSLSDFVTWLSSEKELKARSIRATVAGVKKYLEWLHGRIPIPDFYSPDLPRVNQRKAYTPSDGDIAKYSEIVSVAIPREPSRTILLLLPYCGLRISEFCSLPLALSIKLRDIGGKRWTTLTAITKGGDEKELPVVPPGNELLSLYVYGWRARFPRNTKWLFPGKIPNHITPNTVRRSLNKVRDLMGLPKLTPHAVRRFFATHQHIVKGNDIATVSRMLGHKTTKTTELYYINPTTRQVLSKIKT